MPVCGRDTVSLQSVSEEAELLPKSSLLFMLRPLERSLWCCLVPLALVWLAQPARISVCL